MGKQHGWIRRLLQTCRIPYPQKSGSGMGKGSKGTASGTVKKMGALGAVFCCLFQFMHTADFRPPVERRLAC
ncbi:MAG: hypothetical protein HFH30_14980 [Eubacterium sp.]|jgi:hypothetical protein|nr:hypothetical protein [Eubacterium sp.]